MGEFKITAYSSTPDQTDDSPFIMASGKHVYDGAVASNFLPLGTKVRFPELYGDKVFVVEDRMNRRFQDRIDIWMPTRSEALTFGMRYASVEVLK
ncbi:3D domain-containing protein [Candidatus Azambacteria bacterium]|nr:3D domain-containing protein [Candidatus Azambacteria bacterium]